MNFESVHNYYERLVFERIHEALVVGEGLRDEDFLEDVACVALNHLPAKYVRHDVDMIFYLTIEERESMTRLVSEAVAEAREFVSKHREGKKSTT